MAGAFGAVHYKKLFEGKFQFEGEGFDLLLQGALLQGVVLVEEGCDEHRVDGHHDERERKHERPQVDGQELAAVGDDRDYQSFDDRRKDHHEADRLDHVCDERELGGLVEAVTLLQIERAVDAEGQFDEHLHDCEPDGKNHRTRDLRHQCPLGRQAEEGHGHRRPFPHQRHHIVFENEHILCQAEHGGEHRKVPLVEAVGASGLERRVRNDLTQLLGNGLLPQVLALPELEVRLEEEHAAHEHHHRLLVTEPIRQLAFSEHIKQPRHAGW
mmetsp:Transcript_9790/g.16818  ORF Transcript_9790/g.16818 Transcript_9790/m.16818 type:complete len:270 (+) Transcript_9790:457-1266(+)